MADATRFQVLSKQIEEPKQATDSISTQIEKLTQSQAQIDKLLQSQQKMEAMMAALMSQRSSQLSRPPDPPYSASGDLTSYSQAPQPPDPPDCKSEFPKFDGTLLQDWFRRCDQYFYLHKTPPEMRVRIASPHVIGKALLWHTNYIRNNFGMFPPWPDYTIAISAEFGDNDALLMHQSSLSPYHNQNNQSHYKIPNTTSLLLPLETTKALPYKPNFHTEINMEMSPRKLSHEEMQESGMRGLCESSDGSYANGHHLESKKSQIFVVECDDEESCDDREPSEVTVEEIIDKSVDMIREEKPTPENESSPEVSPQILPSQFQVSLSSLEPGRRYHKESLVVVNDLTYDHGCVIGKTIGSVCVSELGQANSHDEEEFKGLNLGKLLENERLLSIVFLLGLNDMSCWTQLLRQQIFPKSWRFKFKTESSGEAILLNTYRAVCLGVYNSSLEEKLELSGWKYKKQINQGHICLNGLCNELVCDEEKKRESVEFNECHNHLKKLLATMEGLAQMISCGLLCGDSKFHLKHKWKSRLIQALSELQFVVENGVLFTSPDKLLFSNTNNHKLLHPETGFCTQYNDLELLNIEHQSSPGLDYFTYLNFIWKQVLNCVCEDGHISSRIVSVGGVHGLEAQRKRLLVLNEMSLLENNNKIDLTIQENWFHTNPMIRGVFHLQRPPELFDLHENLDFITKVLVQWKEHPPDQFFSGFYGQVLLLSSLRTRMF